jgi:hypothetical protein
MNDKIHSPMVNQGYIPPEEMKKMIHANGNIIPPPLTTGTLCEERRLGLSMMFILSASLIYKNSIKKRPKSRRNQICMTPFYYVF